MIELNLEEIDELTGIVHNDSSTLVELIQRYGKLYARKTVKSPKILGFSLDFLARYLCSREVKILERVKGLKGSQQIIEQDSPTSFISEYSGTLLKKAKSVPNDYFEKCREILELSHRRGVAYIDPDLMIDEKGNPVLIDLVASILYKPNGKVRSRIMKPFFEYVCEMNKRYLCRIKLKYLPNEVTSEEINEANKLTSLIYFLNVYHGINNFLKHSFINYQ